VRWRHGQRGRTSVEAGKIEYVDEGGEAQDEQEEICLERLLQCKLAGAVANRQFLDRRDIEVPLPPYSIHREQLTDSRFASSEQLWRAVGEPAEFLALEDRRRHDGLRNATKHVLLLQSIQVDIRVNLCHEVHEVDVQKRMPNFDRVGHCHPITMIGKEMVGQPQFEIQIRSFVEKMSAAHTVLPQRHRLETIVLR